MGNLPCCGCVSATILSVMTMQGLRDLDRRVASRFSFGMREEVRVRVVGAMLLQLLAFAYNDRVLILLSWIGLVFLLRCSWHKAGSCGNRIEPLGRVEWPSRAD